MTTNLLIEEGKPHSYLHVARDVSVKIQMQEKLGKAYEELTESHRRLKERQD